MKRLLLFGCCLFGCMNGLFAQDTTLQYFTEKGSRTLPEFSDNYTKFYYAEGYWHKQFYKTEGNILMREQTARDSSFKVLDGVSNSFYSSGKLEGKRIYSNGKMQEAYRYYEDGKVNAHVLYAKSGKIKTQEGWDEAGNKIEPFIYEQPAAFPGGPSGWKDFLSKNLNQNVPKLNGAPANFVYHVIVAFAIDKDGNVTDVVAIQDPGYGTAQEAVRVVKSSPQWTPAIQYNKTVKYRQRQQVSFQVAP